MNTHARRAWRILSAIEQFELLRTLVEIVAQRYAISPLLDLSRFRPQFQVHRVTSLEHLSQSRYMYRICHVSFFRKENNETPLFKRQNFQEDA